LTEFLVTLGEQTNINSFDIPFKNVLKIVKNRQFNKLKFVLFSTYQPLVVGELTAGEVGQELWSEENG